MTLSVHDELRRTFELASLRREARYIGAPHQWQRAATVQTRCENARVREKDLYAARYEARVEARRRVLVAEAGQVRREFRPWWAVNDRFDPAATLRQAQRDVRSAHAARIERIDEYEHRQLKAVVERARRENQLRGLARSEFERTADRRSGIERRQTRQRTH